MRKIINNAAIMILLQNNKVAFKLL